MKKENIAIRNSQSVESILKEAANFPLLTNEQEMELVNRVQKGDEKALKQLVEGNLRFGVSVAKQYQDEELTLEDLIEEGTKGLEQAARMFNPDRGFKFISYAVWFIRQSIFTALKDKGSRQNPQNS